MREQDSQPPLACKCRQMAHYILCVLVVGRAATRVGSMSEGIDVVIRRRRCGQVLRVAGGPSIIILLLNVQVVAKKLVHR